MTIKLISCKIIIKLADRSVFKYDRLEKLWVAVCCICWRNLTKYDKEKFIIANLFASFSPQYLISDFIFNTQDIVFMFCSFFLQNCIYLRNTNNSKTTWVTMKPLCSLCCVSWNGRLQGKRYIWFNNNLSHWNFVTLLYFFHS